MAIVDRLRSSAPTCACTTRTCRTRRRRSARQFRGSTARSRRSQAADLVVLCVDHPELPYDDIVDHARLVLDTRGRLPRPRLPRRVALAGSAASPASSGALAAAIGVAHVGHDAGEDRAGSTRLIDAVDRGDHETDGGRETDDGGEQRRDRLASAQARRAGTRWRPRSPPRSRACVACANETLNRSAAATRNRRNACVSTNAPSIARSSTAAGEAVARARRSGSSMPIAIAEQARCRSRAR